MAFEQVSVNFVSVLVAAVAAIIISALWNGPLFGRVLNRLRGKVKMSAKPVLLSLLSTMLTAYVLAVFLIIVNAATMGDAITVGLLFWIGFSVPLKLSPVLWEKKPGKLFLLEVVLQLVILVVMSVLLMV